MARNALVTTWIVLWVLSGSGCVSAELDQFERAQLAYRQCLDLHPGHPERCEAEKARADQRFREYEERAQRSWGCEHARDECQQDRRSGE
jgi:hypothetical protein